MLRGTWGLTVLFYIVLFVQYSSNGISVILILKYGIGEGAGLRYHSALRYVVFHPFG